MRPHIGQCPCAGVAQWARVTRAQVARVEVVGDTTPLTFTRDSSGLHVEVPERASHDFGVARKVIGDGLVD